MSMVDILGLLLKCNIALQRIEPVMHISKRNELVENLLIFTTKK